MTILRWKKNLKLIDVYHLWLNNNYRMKLTVFGVMIRQFSQIHKNLLEISTINCVGWQLLHSKWPFRLYILSKSRYNLWDGKICHKSLAKLALYHKIKIDWNATINRTNIKYWLCAPLTLHGTWHVPKISPIKRTYFFCSVSRMVFSS